MFILSVSTIANNLQLHLATCTNLFPHVSLMNYTYLPSTPYNGSPTIVMTTNPSSKKTLNLVSNPNVSLLVHDWVSHRPPTTNRRGSAGDRIGLPPPEASRSSLASLLLNLNTSAISSISATINGKAKLVERGTDEERYYKERHLENNTFAEGSEAEGARNLWGEAPDGGREMYIEGEAVRVVVVRITDGRVSDWKGGVRGWNLGIAEAAADNHVADGGLVNGVV